MRKLTGIIFIFILCGGCSAYVAEHNKRYVHPANELNTNIQIIEGCKLSDSFKYDGIDGHRHFRFAGLLLEEENSRVVDIYIPNNSQTGRPVIEEVEAYFDKAGKELAYLYIDTNNTNRKTVDENYQKEHLLIVNLAVVEKTDAFPKKEQHVLTLSAFSKDCLQAEDDEKECERNWEIDPDFDWVKRSRAAIWFRRTQYLVTLPFDAAVFALAFTVAAAGE